uniref:Uncharacterized protein n=1 Tax=Rhodosorus marinus TaxID=101924 RepID=A0A7S0BHA1_9RHOD
MTPDDGQSASANAKEFETTLELRGHVGRHIWALERKPFREGDMSFRWVKSLPTAFALVQGTKAFVGCNRKNCFSVFLVWWFFFSVFRWVGPLRWTLVVSWGGVLGE